MEVQKSNYSDMTRHIQKQPSVGLLENLYLFDSRGKLIVIDYNWQLYCPKGQHIGRYVPQNEFYIDCYGCYLGEIVLQDRLLFNTKNPYQSLNFGRCGDFGTIEVKNPDLSKFSITKPHGFLNIPIERL